MEKYIYELTMKVRDYECDLQGIVNNANYQHYLEHTRHEFLLSTGVPALPPANPAFNLLPCPHPPNPLPGGKGVTKVILCKGLRPLHPRG